MESLAEFVNSINSVYAAIGGLAVVGAVNLFRKDKLYIAIPALLGAVLLIVNLPILIGLDLMEQDRRVAEALRKGEPVREIVVPVEPN